MGFSKEGCLRSHRTTHSPLQPLKAKEISTDQDDQTMPMAMGMGLADWQLATGNFYGCAGNGSVPMAYKCIHRI